MKKRIVALLLCCVMLLTLSPSLIASASADDENTVIEQTKQTEDKKDAGQVEEVKDETKDEVKDETKDEVKDETKDETKAETKDEVKDEAKEEQKPADEPKNEEPAALEQPTTPEPSTEDEGKIPQTVVFTDAGPFLPAVNVAAARSMLRAPTKDTKDDGLKLNKTAKANKDGTYTITMEAYTTGEVTTVTKTAPVDIVLVLDQSGSMAYNFAGERTSVNSERRQYAMKQAVNTFIAAVGEKYGDEADHRIAIVTFGSNANTRQNWTFVDSNGIVTLQNSISSLPDSPSGATNVGAGMQRAETLMGSSYSYTGANTQRQKVVIVFTDGVPTTQSNFDTSVANGAITAANSMKNSGVTIYSVGIFNGADPDKIHGDYYYRAVLADNPCDGSVGSYWGTTNLSGGNANDFVDPDVPAGNRFLNYISNNYTAENIGLEFSNTDGLAGGYKWTITNNFSGSNADYYLTANNSESLNKIFQTISENIQTSDIDLGTTTVIKDTITPYFDVPANTTDIKLYTASAKANGTFENRQDAPSDVRATISGNAVSVTGFDFNANFVSKTAKSDGTYGKKLIIEFTVQPKDRFLGGNNVPTNGTDSGIYKDGEPIKTFDVPAVNVPVADIVVSVNEKNVYLNHEMTENECLTGTTVTAKRGNTTVATLNLSADNYDLESWQTAFVTITKEVQKPADAMTADGNYTVTVKAKPQKALETSEGEAATEKSANATGNINVFKPEVTFKDSQITLGEEADYANNKGTNFEVWKHDGTTAPAEMGTAPTLTYNYNPKEDTFPQDTPVKVSKVEINSKDVTSHVTFYREACDICNNALAKVTDDVNFIVHVKSLSLKISKQGASALDKNQSFVFVVSNNRNDALKIENLEVVIHGNESVTLNGLPIGNYTITEKDSWSWRYTPDAQNQKVTLTKNDTTIPEVTFNNTRIKDLWLTGGAYCDNRWINNTTVDSAPKTN